MSIAFAQAVEELLQSADCVLAKHEQIAVAGAAFPWCRFSLLVQLVAPALEVASAPACLPPRPANIVPNFLLPLMACLFCTSDNTCRHSPIVLTTCRFATLCE